MSRRLIVTGARGFVAGSVIAQALGTWEVHALSRSPAFLEREGLHWHPLNIGDPAALRQCFRDVAPEAVIHTAALADIDYCEAHPDEAEQVNAEVPRQLAGLCAAVGARLIHCSTDNVFDGEQGNYSEEDPPGPLSVYARSKVKAEQYVAAMGQGAVAARVAVVMGFPVLGAGNSFLSRMVPRLASGQKLGVPNNEIRSPIDVITLGRALLELAASPYTGCLHLAGNDILNRFDMVRRIARRLNFDENLAVPNDPSGIPGRAARPRDVSLNNAKARILLKTSFCGLEEGLERVLAFQSHARPA